MYLLEEPFVSDLLVASARESGLAILDTPMARRRVGEAWVTSSEEFAKAALAASSPRLYTNSENALAWVREHCSDRPLATAVDVLKDKVRFRELLASLDPGYRFVPLPAEELDTFDPATIPVPFVVKPATGFFSLGVHVVESVGDWPDVLARIQRDRVRFASLYPEHVLDLDRWVVEEVIEGEEFAIDVYYRSDGEAVVVGILEHPFAHGADVSDRVYRTSVETFEKWRLPFEEYLGVLGERFSLRDFAMHIELRVDANGTMRPIEANPLRFGGWCAADMAFHAWGFDPYRAYLEDRRPDWDTIFATRRGKVFALVVADLPASIDRNECDIDYDAFAARFSRVLELRRVEDRRHPVFAFTFVEVESGREEELDAVLVADLSEYAVPRAAQ